MSVAKPTGPHAEEMLEPGGWPDVDESTLTQHVTELTTTLQQLTSVNETWMTQQAELTAPTTWAGGGATAAGTAITGAERTLAEKQADTAKNMLWCTSTAATVAATKTTIAANVTAAQAEITALETPPIAKDSQSQIQQIINSTRSLNQSAVTEAAAQVAPASFNPSDATVQKVISTGKVPDDAGTPTEKPQNVLTPSTPDTPSAPSTPTDPSTPESPSTPSTPTSPDTPSSPTTPTGTTTPVSNATTAANSTTTATSTAAESTTSTASDATSSMSQYMQMPMQMAQQAAQIPSQLASSASQGPQTVMQTAEQVAQQVSQMSGSSGKDTGDPSTIAASDHAQTTSSNPDHAQAASAHSGAERAPTGAKHDDFDLDLQLRNDTPTGAGIGGATNEGGCPLPVVTAPACTVAVPTAKCDDQLQTQGRGLPVVAP